MDSVVIEIDDLPPAAKAVERTKVKETAMQRLVRESVAFFMALSLTTVMALLFTIPLCAAFLTIDLPFHRLDRFFLDKQQFPSQWLSWGALWMSTTPMLTILYARRFGSDEASRVVTVAWAMAALAIFAEISYLMPELEAADLPSLRFVIVFVISSMLAAYVAAGIYDITRGGGAWWRAPLYAAMCGFAVQGLVYFPVIYWNAGVPFLNWMIGDLVVKLFMTFGFLGVYWLLRKPLRPRGGYGG